MNATTEPGMSGDVAIIGMAGRMPGADSLEGFWQNLRAGVEAITFFDRDVLRAAGVPEELLADPRYVPAAPVLADVDRFDAHFFGYSAREAALIDPQQRIFLECAWEALEDAGYPPGAMSENVGVYGGAALSSYLLHNLLAGRGVTTIAQTLELLVTNDKDYLANRVAYQLGLRGPAVAVQSACSSSLVAVHLAGQALLDGDCDVALAGGVAVRLPQPAGYLWEEGLVFSADGHCRPYDAEATGTLFGSGAGVVVLKRIEDALADGDRVLAVVRGSAVTNDGSAKVGYTAPGMDGQARAIATAMGLAGVEPETITAIEGHGTATALGDPIEVAALTRAFGSRTRRTGYCALGSVKSNVGHLDTAAGIAGLIKAILQLRNRELVPSLNFRRPNPEIDFPATPFVVNTELRDWTPSQDPRRIGVSSFGMGGTNAHVILQEAEPVPARPEPAPGPQVIVLSAREPAALRAGGTALAEALGAPDAPALADVAYTLQVGRLPMPHRRALVVADLAAAGAGLVGELPDREVVGRAADRPRVVFLLPGQGSQHPGMGAQLYAGYEVFRREVDGCAQVLHELLGLDLRTVLYPPAGTDPAEAAARLERTDLAQPALFTVGYALARQLAAWGVQPDAMAGHSVGEVLAACLSGVLTRDDALRLVAIRGRLMQQMPAGQMLSVSLGIDELTGLLPDGVEVAAVNAAGLCAVSGPADEITNLATELSGRGVSVTRLRTSHAFHSAMMEPMLAPFAAELTGLAAAAPTVPYVSNLTGNWITDEEATDPGYWVRHVRRPVQFAAAVDLLTAAPGTVLVEIGPGQTLTTLAGQAAHRVPAVAAMPRGGPVEELTGLLLAMARLWTCGVPVDLPALRAGDQRRRVALPTYAFQRRRHWVSPAGGDGRVGGGLAGLDSIEVDAGQAPVDGSDPDGSEGNRPPVGTAFVAARNDSERRVAAVFQDLLGVTPVGMDDNFVELGGHSLLATRVVSRLKETFGVPLTLRQMLTAPTVAGLARLVTDDPGPATVQIPNSGPATMDGSATGDRAASDRAASDPANGDQESVAVAAALTADGLPVVVPAPEDAHLPFPLTEIQQAQWIGRLGSFEGGNVAAHVYWEVDTGDVDLTRLEDSWQEIIERHGMLRAVVLPDGQQRVLPEVPRYRIEVLDLRSDGPAQVQTRLADLRAELTGQMRPADRWPLFDVRASLLPDGQTRLHLGFDLLIADIGSIRLISRDWRRRYADQPLAPLTLTYRDYVLAMERLRTTDVYAQARDYWRDRIPQLPARPDLPLSGTPAAAGQPDSISYDLNLNAVTWQRITEQAGRRGLTPSAVMLAAYAMVVGRWSRTGAFILNVTVINRLPVHEEVGDLVGEFASFDLVPADLTAEADLVSLARRLQEQSWSDLEHRAFNGVEVLREMARARGGSGGAISPVVFTSTIVQASESGDETWFGWLGDVVHEVAQTPQVWLDFALLETADGVRLSWHAGREVFAPGVLEGMFEAFRGVVEGLGCVGGVWSSVGVEPVGLAGLVRSVNGVGDVMGVDAGDVVDVAGGVAGGVVDVGDGVGGLLVDGLVGWAVREPGRLAVVGGDGSRLSFGELVGWASGLARVLVAGGVGVGDVVAVAVPRSVEQVVAVVGVLLAGGAYLPVDVDLPRGRREGLVLAGGCGWVVVGSGGVGLGWPVGVGVVGVDGCGDRGGPVVVSPASASDVAYVIFTSGSTGSPKGVAVSHRAAVNTCVDVCERFGVGSSDVVLGLSSLSFDLSVFDVFGVLGVGGVLVVPRYGSGRDPGHWVDLVGEYSVSVWNSVPALAEMVLAQVGGGSGAVLGSVRLALWSGDWVAVDLADRWRVVAPGCRVVALGGATEAGIWSIFHEVVGVVPGWDSVPYGRPLANQWFYVVNDRWQECPVWVVGELCIGGVGLAEGYWGDEERSGERFVVHPLRGERVYRTGDLGRRWPDGTIEFLGREDQQVKVGGFRIELGEVEVVLGRCVGVSAVVVVVVGDRHHRRLVGFVVPAATTEETAEDLTTRLTEYAGTALPIYMVPGTLHVVDRLPLTVNGKIDRAALVELAGTPTGGGVPVADGGPVAEALARIMGQVIGVDTVGLHDNLFTLGGDSIAGIQIVNLANAEGLDVTAADLFSQPHLAALAATVSERGSAAGADAASLPLTSYQRTLLARAGDPAHLPAYRILLPVDDPDRAVLAVRAVTARHGAVRLRLAREGAGYRQWVEESDPADLEVPLVDLRALPEHRRALALRQMVTDLAGEVDPLNGPTAKATVFLLGPGDSQLAWVVSSLAVDAASWPALLGELVSAPTAPPGVPAPALAGLIAERGRSEQDARIATESGSDRSIDRLVDGQNLAGPVPVESGPGSEPSRLEELIAGSGSAGARSSQSGRAFVRLTRERTGDLMARCERRLRLQPGEVAAVVLSLALSRLGSATTVTIDVERDTRVSAAADASRATGPLSEIVAVDLDLAAGDLADLVAAVKQAYRNPNAGVGNPRTPLLLRDLGDLGDLLDLGRLGQLGQLGELVEVGDLGDSSVQSETDPSGPTIEAAGPYPVTVVSSLERGQLTLAVTAPPGSRIAAALLEEFPRALADLADHTAESSAATASTIDFPLAGLDPGDLAAFLSAVIDRGSNGGAGSNGDHGLTVSGSRHPGVGPAQEE